MDKQEVDWRESLAERAGQREEAQEALERHVEREEERRMERSFCKQVVELSGEGMSADAIAEKLQADREVIVETLKEMGCGSSNV